MKYLVSLIYYGGCFAIGYFGRANGVALSVGLFLLNALIYFPIMSHLRQK